MKTINLTSSDKKNNLLLQLAKDMGVKTQAHHELTDEEMALPGPKVSKEQLETWLAKEDGESYGIDEAFDMMKSNLGYTSAERKRKSKSVLETKLKPLRK